MQDQNDQELATSIIDRIINGSNEIQMFMMLHRVMFLTLTYTN